MSKVDKNMIRLISYYPLPSFRLGYQWGHSNNYEQPCELKILTPQHLHKNTSVNGKIHYPKHGPLENIVQIPIKKITAQQVPKSTSVFNVSSSIDSNFVLPID